MNLDLKIKALLGLAKDISQVLNDDGNLSSAASKLKETIPVVRAKNAWFTEDNVKSALQGLAMMLNEEDLTEWLSRYLAAIKENESIQTVGLVLAGNIPAVGFHDLLCVYLVGNKAKVKLSSDDKDIIPVLLEMLAEQDNTVSGQFQIVEQLQGIDKVIATGSDNSARYFEYYFSKFPSIIRKNRTSVAVIQEGDGEQVFDLLAEDLFMYYGLGCRNITRLFVPKGFQMSQLMDRLASWNDRMQNNKYINNLDYHKSIFLINSTPFLDGGFYLMKEDDALFSPVSVIHYSFYENKQEIENYLTAHKDKVQCIVDAGGQYDQLFGAAQQPKIWDYADQIDVVEFLLEA